MIAAVSAIVAYTAPIKMSTNADAPIKLGEKLNDDVKIKFEEIIAEPDGYHSSKYIWHLSNEVYLFCKDAGYQIMSLFCGIPMAAFWGVLFAFVACAHVWIYAPL